jgi:nicotinamidase-related amidase
MTQLHPHRSVVVVVDIQELFRSVIERFEDVAHATSVLVQGARVLGIPVIVTEQYPKGLGSTVPEIAEHLGEAPRLEKTTLSAVAADGFDLGGRDQVLLCGIEAHICVYQTAMDLLRAGVDVQVVEDAVSSRSEANRRVGIERIVESGGRRTSTEMALFELLGRAGTAEFKAVQQLVR